MQRDEDSLLKNFSTARILAPVAIGLTITGLLIWRTADLTALEHLSWTWRTSFWIFLGLLSQVVRDGMYVVRLHHLTDKKLTWSRTFVVIMLWEFASALAPGMLGGGFLFAIWFLSRENVDTGTSITVITFTSFLDGIFLAIMAPLVYFWVGHEALFAGTEFTGTFVGRSIFAAFWVVYFIILAYKLFVAYALFVNPTFIKRALVGIFSLPLLRRWRRNAVTTGNQLIVAANGLKHRGWGYWWPALLTTFASWTARFLVVNCILHAFPHGFAFSDVEVFGKQVIMGIIVLLSPTPGGSGLAEFIFNDFLGMYVAPGLAPAIALLWRLLSYYPYILIGAILLPRWVRRNVIAAIIHPQKRSAKDGL